MMLVRKCLIPVLSPLLSLLLLCGSLPLVAQPAVKLRIDPAHALGGTVSDLFAAVTYIPLETTKESLFGSIQQLQVTPAWFVILDNETNSILLFHRNGKFYTRFDLGPKSRKYYPTGIPYFTVDNARGEIAYKIDRSTRMVYTIATKQLKEEQVLSSSWEYPLTGGRTVYGEYNLFKDPAAESGVELTWQREGVTYKTAMPYAIRETPFARQDRPGRFGPGFYFGGHDSVAFYTRMYDLSIYQVTPDTVRTAYTLLLPADMSLPPDFATSSSYRTKRLLFLREEKPQAVYAISDVTQVGQFLFFTLESMYSQAVRGLGYDLSSSATYSMNQISPDQRNHFLPVTSNIKNFLATDGTDVYSSVSSLKMFQSLDTVRTKGAKLPPALETYFRKENQYSNPVLVQLRPKQQ